MILYTPEEIKKIMEDNFDKSMDLPAFYHNLLREFGLKEEEWFPPQASIGKTVTVTLNKQQSDKLHSDILNQWQQEAKTSKPKKEWEILEWSTPHGWHTIKSVKRLSDGEIFTVGDEVIHKTDPKELANTAKIASLFVPIDMNKIWFHFDNSDCVKDLSNFNKLPAKTPLFTSEDGVPIYEDSKLWYLYLPYGDITEWKIAKTIIAKLDGQEKFKLFSTEEAAKAYWDKHKPQEKEYTKKDLENAFIGGKRWETFTHYMQLKDK